MKKSFNQLTTEEIQALSQEEYDNVSPFEKKNCADCKYLIENLSLWCSNKDAIDARGTRIPGCIKCPYWEPDWYEIPKKYHTEEYGYLSLSKQIKQDFKYCIDKIKSFFNGSKDNKL